MMTTFVTYIYRYLHIFLLTILLAGMSHAQAQTYSDIYDSPSESDDSIRVSLVVVDQGDMLYSAFGHACLRVENVTQGTDYIYTYEGEPVTNQVVKFLRGQLHMGMFCVPTQIVLQMYEQDHRGVRSYAMNLSSQDKLRLTELLEGRIAQGINLAYDYYHRGCAQTIVELVTQAVDTIEYAPWSDKYTGQTQRELCYQGGDGRPWALFWAFSLIGNGPDCVDIDCKKKLLVPNDLVEVWQQASVKGYPLLAAKANILVDSEAKKHTTALTPLAIACMLLILSIVSLVMGIYAPKGTGKNNGNGIWRGISKDIGNGVWTGISNGIDYLLLVIVSLMGGFETYLVVLSDLPCTDWHWLLIPFNILPLLLWPWRRYWANAWAGVLGVWMIGILLWPHQLVASAHLVLTLTELVWILSVGYKQQQTIKQ